MLIGPARDRVRTTVARIVKDGKLPTLGRVIAGLSFGFWRFQEGSVLGPPWDGYEDPRILHSSATTLIVRRAMHVDAVLSCDLAQAGSVDK